MQLAALLLNGCELKVIGSEGGLIVLAVQSEGGLAIIIAGGHMRGTPGHSGGWSGEKDFVRSERRRPTTCGVLLFKAVADNGSASRRQHGQAGACRSPRRAHRDTASSLRTAPWCEHHAAERSSQHCAHLHTSTRGDTSRHPGRAQRG